MRGETERRARWLWVGASLVGAGVVVVNWRDAALDYKALRLLPDYRPDGPRAITSRASIRRQKIRFLYQVTALAVGVAASLDDTPPPVRSSAVRLLTIAALVGGQVALVLNDILDRRDYYRTLYAPGPAAHHHHHRDPAHEENAS